MINKYVLIGDVVEPRKAVNITTNKLEDIERIIYLEAKDFMIFDMLSRILEELK